MRRTLCGIITGIRDYGSGHCFDCMKCDPTLFEKTFDLTADAVGEPVFAGLAEYLDGIRTDALECAPRLTASERATILFSKHAGPVPRAVISAEWLPEWERLVSLGIIRLDNGVFSLAEVA